ncbi:spore protein [Anaerosporomusa subterranea]|uniref:Spore protein n=1 Tax=Anaerosporomusa subterranea TaxID=1794912 RepID=A0A154BQF5_ANASB|nr:small, acid-soluble spore protein, alpha/beta type [Anaerosporomusa subterranea]KYZ76253.1 spore protein [Anaerosporomusa subterranea]
MKGKIDTMEELDASLPDKHKVAEELGIPLDQGDNGNLTTREVGKIGGKIGGEKVKKMIAMAESYMVENAEHETTEAKAERRTEHTI